MSIPVYPIERESRPIPVQPIERVGLYLFNK